MNIDESDYLINNEHPEFLPLSAYFSFFETDPDCTVDYVLDDYFEHRYSFAEIHKILVDINSLLEKYQYDIDTLNVLCLGITFNYYYLLHFESGVELLTYIRDYLSAKLKAAGA